MAEIDKLLNVVRHNYDKATILKPKATNFDKIFNFNIFLFMLLGSISKTAKSPVTDHIIHLYQQPIINR